MATSADGAAVDLALPAGTRIGPWEIEQLIGSGGMGSVYRARRADGLYEQTVALKIVGGLSESETARFERERQWLARLEHPNIARILDGGADEAGHPYLVMELVQGDSIIAAASGGDARTTIALLRQLCAALSHAHNRLVLHRDVKPDNVLIDERGSVRLVDFGIAAEIGNDEKLGRAMTLAYAAPEQLRGEPASAATDIFAAGCLAYRLLVGDEPPRAADGAVDIDPALLPDRDMAAIIGRATAFAEAERYASIDAFDADLNAWLDHRPVDARGGGAAYRFGKAVSRYRLAASLTGLTIVALVGGIIASLIFADRARQEAERANEALARAEWSVERGDIFNRAQAAYADVLQRLFGSQGDIEAQTAALLERVKEAQLRADEEPDNAAFVSFTIGRHFLFRNDYPTAISILEPWIEQEYGPERFRVYGQQLLAIAYMNRGETAKAVPLLREVVKVFDQGYDANTADHAAAASQLAFTTGEKADLLTASRVLTAAQVTNTEPGIRIFFWNQLAVIRRMLGDLPGGREAIAKAVELIDENRLTEIAGKDTARVNLAEYEYYLSKDFGEVRALIDTVLTEDAVAKGESRELGRAMTYDGLLAARSGDISKAIVTLEEAVTLTDRFGGTQSAASIHARIVLAEILAMKGDRQRAIAMLDVADSIDDAQVAADSEAERVLARIYVLAKTGSLSAARSLARNRDWKRADFTTSARATFRRDRLAEMGVMK